jgi:hypothetical protein
MNEETAIFPLPAGAGLNAQAEALARAAWLMGGPDDSPIYQGNHPDGILERLSSEGAKDSTADDPMEGPPVRNPLRDSTPENPAPLSPPPSIPDR